MRKLTTFVTAATFLALPAQAADWHGVSSDVRAGAFVGARLRLSLGAGSSAKPQASLTIAPTRSYRSAGDRTVTRFGEGVALDFAGRRPTLKLGGIPAGAAFGVRPQGRVDPNRRLGLSTTAWVGIGAVAVLATVLVITNLTCVGKDPDYCGSD